MATGYTPPGATCCCGGDCYTSAPDSVCLALNAECAGWSAEPVTVTKSTTTTCVSGATGVVYTGAIPTPCGQINTAELVLRCPASVPVTSVLYGRVTLYNTGILFPKSSCQYFSSAEGAATPVCTSDGATVFSLYNYMADNINSDPDCIKPACDCPDLFGFVSGYLVGTVDVTLGPCGGVMMAAPRLMTAAAPAGGGQPYRPLPPARPRICLYAERVEHRAGCSGFRCRHRCTSPDPGVRAALGESDIVLPADECQTCPGFTPRP